MVFALFAFASCSKDADVVTPDMEQDDDTQDGEGGDDDDGDSSTSTPVTVQFTASMLEMSESRAITLREDWSDGDEIIIFVDGEDSSSSGYIYNVSSDGTLSAAGDAITGYSDISQIYYAFSPVNLSYKSLDDYYQASPYDEVDILSAVASGKSSVDFTFSHDLAALFFSMESEASDISAKVNVGSTSYTLDLDIDGMDVSSSLFVSPESDLSSATLVCLSTAGTTTRSLETTSFTEWTAGKYYVYRDITIGAIEGEGTLSNPYRIYSESDLLKIGSEWDLSMQFRLMNDIDLGGSASNQWTPIGASTSKGDSNNFSGTFDGNGYTISGLYIDTDEPFQGLFGFVYFATICNLTVEGEVSTTDQNCGGIVSMSNYSYIVNCHNKAKVTGTSRVGGIAGGSGNSFIVNCSNRAAIAGDDYAASEYSEYMQMRVGGITGTSASTYVYNCYNVGSVSNASGSGYAVAAPSGDDNYESIMFSCYYSDNCGGIDPDATSTALSESSILSSSMVDDLNSNLSYINNTLFIGCDYFANDWELGSDGYPTTNLTTSTPGVGLSGNGSINSPYLISSANDLKIVQTMYSLGSIYTTLYFKLTQDIDLGGSATNQWTPIEFAYGVFDGNGYTISGLYIDTDQPLQGLFEFIIFATICNLTVDGEVSTTDQNCGGIAGMSVFAHIINCHNKATITGTSRVGGISGGSGNSFIVNCSNRAAIAGNDYDTSENSSSMQMRVGGITGTSGDTYIYNCYNVGSVNNIHASGSAYAVASPGGNDINPQYVDHCYYSDDCGGIDPDATSTALSESYIKSSSMVDDLNDNTPYINYALLIDRDYVANEWVMGSDGYPTTNLTAVEPNSGIGLSGDGTYSSPYLISSASDLKIVASMYNDITSAEDLNPTLHFSLTKDINLAGSASNQWTPIGDGMRADDYTNFTGVFNGNGYTISGLYIDTDEPFQGLFGFAYNATICNLTVEGEVSTTDQNCGGIAAMSVFAHIINCHNKATITGTSRVGGISGGSGHGYIINCSNTAEIAGDDYATSQYSEDMQMRIGGITGTSGDVYIYNCYNVGSVSNASGSGYAVAAPSGDDSYPQYVNLSYYSDDCGGIDPDATSTALSESVMSSTSFIATLNGNISNVNSLFTHQYGYEASEWTSGTDGYPVTQ